MSRNKLVDQSVLVVVALLFIINSANRFKWFRNSRSRRWRKGGMERWTFSKLASSVWSDTNGRVSCERHPFITASSNSILSWLRRLWQKLRRSRLSVICFNYFNYKSANAKRTQRKTFLVWWRQENSVHLWLMPVEGFDRGIASYYAAELSYCCFLVICIWEFLLLNAAS